MTEQKDTFEDVLRDGNVAFFGCDARVLPDIVREKKNGRVKMYARQIAVQNKKGDRVAVLPYERLAQVREEKADVYFVDNEATKVLFADFPATAKFVLVRFTPRISWLFGLPGLLRRIYIGLVHVRGVVTMQSGDKKYRWLLIEHNMRESHNPRLCLSEEVGVQGFIDFLNAEGIKYVVLRFYEKLPQLNRIGGDLDILVSDEDDARLRSFLQEHPGPIGIDVWTVSRASHGAITYYPPPLARKIIKSAVVGPAGARIPAPYEAFLGLAYHTLYHKGVFAGVPSLLKGVKVNLHPENDYKGTLVRLAKEAHVEVDIEMEALDEYLAEAGWRPKLDTLAKIAIRNQWVWKRFFSGDKQPEIGLSVLIIKRAAIDLGVSESILQLITESRDFKVIRKRVFTKEEVTHVADQLRGGVWNEKGGNLEDFLPAIAVAVVDTSLASTAQYGTVQSSADKGIKALKSRLRSEFKAANGNLVHSTDNTHEAGEYLDICFPEEVDAIYAEAERLCSVRERSTLQKVTEWIERAPSRIVYTLSLAKQRLGKVLLHAVMK